MGGRGARGGVGPGPPLDTDGTPYTGPDDLRAVPRRADGPAHRRDAASAAHGAEIEVGGAVFDGATGRLTRLFGLDVEGPRLELWRAPIDNDRYDGTEFRWRLLGLHRLTHRVDAVEPGDALTVRTRVAPAATDLGMRATYTWTASGDALDLRVDIVPEGDWPEPIPRLGLALTLPSVPRTVTWYGLGPGEAYPDTGMATRVGRWTSTVEGMQTPYVYPPRRTATAPPSAGPSSPGSGSPAPRCSA
ncbi:hypothetical protein ACFSTC_30930 [Nonomuraea ferruginea]